MTSPKKGKAHDEEPALEFRFFRHSLTHGQGGRQIQKIEAQRTSIRQRVNNDSRSVAFGTFILRDGPSNYPKIHDQ